MSNQQVGYYTVRKAALLREFDKTAELVKDTVIARYGTNFTDNLYRTCREEYEALIPHIPYIAGFRARALNTFLVISAQELAVYKGMKTYGKTAEEAWEICHQALRLRMTHYPAIKRWLLKRVMFSGIIKQRFQQRAESGEIHNLGDFQVRFVSGGGEDFDFGVDYLACGIHNFVRAHGGEEFAPYVCMSDIALSDAMDWGLTRTETLADGCLRCNFRFKKGGTTQISSTIPAVQKTIDRIATREMETSASNS